MRRDGVMLRLRTSGVGEGSWRDMVKRLEVESKVNVREEEREER